jgi:hypothetical protein
MTSALTAPDRVGRASHAIELAGGLQVLDEAPVGRLIVEIAHDQHLGLPPRLDRGEVAGGLELEVALGVEADVVANDEGDVLGQRDSQRLGAPAFLGARWPVGGDHHQPLVALEDFEDDDASQASSPPRR